MSSSHRTFEQFNLLVLPNCLLLLLLLVVRFQRRIHWFASSSTTVVESPSKGKRRMNLIRPTNPKQREQQGVCCNASAVTAFFTGTRTLVTTNIKSMMQRCITDQDRRTCPCIPTTTKKTVILPLRTSPKILDIGKKGHSFLRLSVHFRAPFFGQTLYHYYFK